ncbi:hypothetical protein [Aeromicrobium sp. 179-A 4D2 NHS]|uniref:hypothetical protein n=1 Tax=Aeromicrobium sp. 179-A 4D2 NHS TaxID=3142375 RepID=UPI0039A1BFE4
MTTDTPDQIQHHELVLDERRREAMENVATSLRDSMGGRDFKSVTLNVTRTEDGSISELVSVTDQYGGVVVEEPSAKVHEHILWARVCLRLPDTTSFETLVCTITAGDGEDKVHVAPTYPAGYKVQFVIPTA